MQNIRREREEMAPVFLADPEELSDDSHSASNPQKNNKPSNRVSLNVEKIGDVPGEVLLESAWILQFFFAETFLTRLSAYFIQKKGMD